MLNIGCIGLGSIANRHLAAYATSPHIESLSAADPNMANIEAKDCEFRRTTTDYRELLDDDTIQVVDICVPHYLHAPIAIDALEAGKDVILEKPMAMNTEEAEQLAAVAERTGKRLFIAMNQCFMPYHIKAKELIDSGAIGRPFMAVFNIMGNEFRTMNNPDHWKGSFDKAGGGAMIDTGYHVTYMMVRFFGVPSAASAATKRLLVEAENKADDNTGVILEFDNRLLGVIAISYTVSSEDWAERRYIYGTEGSIRLSDEIECPIKLFKDHQEVPVEVEKPAEHPHAVSVGRCIHHYLDCIVHDREPMVTYELALDATRTLDAIYQAGREGRRVELSEVGR